MKQLKPFLPSLYSEYLLTAPAAGDANLIGEDKADGEGDMRGPGGSGKGTYERGLGEKFGFPGDAKKMRERSKMKLWKEYYVSECFMILALSCADSSPRSESYLLVLPVYLREGLMTVLRYPPFQRLLQVGLPSRLRGELWEVMSGSVCTQFFRCTRKANDRFTIRKRPNLFLAPVPKRGQIIAIYR